MPPIKKETMGKVIAFFDGLDLETQKKCALCNETLVHIVKQAEVQTGAGLATITRELASRVNKGAAPGDVVSDDAFRERARVRCRDEKHGGIPQNSKETTTQPDPDQPQTKQEEKPEIKPEPKPKPRQLDKCEKEDRRITDNFNNAMNNLIHAIHTERLAGWSGMTRDTAIKETQNLTNIINIGR